MAIDKLIPQYLNSDTDQKLVKTVEMTDNLNVRVSNDDEGTAGVIKNIKGTEVVGAKSASDVYPSGDNRVIGSVANEKNKEILFLLWNENYNHGIYRLDMTTGKYQKLYQDSVLGFEKFGYADCDVILNEKEETLFYWTDNSNPPMKVNVNRLMSNGYPPSLTSGTDEEKLLSLTVAKQPPIKAPSYVVKNNPNLTGDSRIKENNYQFAYKYVYQDGEHSALSPYSSLSIANAQLVDGFNTDAQKNFFNQIDVFGQNSNGDVEKIVFYARRVGGKFFEIEELDNSYGTSSVKVEFTDNVLGKFLSETEENKIYDNVPQVAKSQAIASNRLFYGSYVEGYDNIDVDVDILPNYHKNPDIYDIDVTIQSTTYNSGRKRRIEIDYSSLPSTIDNASTVILNFFVDFEDVYIMGNSGGGKALAIPEGQLVVTYASKDDAGFEKFKTYTVRQIQGASLSSYLSTIINNLGATGDIPAITLSTEGLQVKETISIPANTPLSTVKSLVQTRLESKQYRVFLNPSAHERRFSSLSDSTSAFAVVADVFTGQEAACFKGVMGMEFEFAGASSNTLDTFDILPSTNSVELSIHEFSDNDGRTVNVLSSTKFVVPFVYFLFPTASLEEGGCVLYESLVGDRSFKSGASHELGIVYYDDRGRASGVQEVGDAYVNHLNDRSSENDLYGRSSMVLRLKHNPPSWAKRWAPVYTGSGNIELKFQYGVKGAFIPTNNLERSTIFSSHDNIYISLNSLFGKDSSYTKSSSALIDYKFEKGDKLRIIKYGSSTSQYDVFNTEKQEFEVVDFVTLNNENTNPILERISERAIDVTTGEFLIVKDNSSASNFNYDSVMKGTSKWFENCIVEVYRNKKDLEEDVYYEVGKSYPVTSGAHGDDRTASTITGTLTTTGGVKKVTLGSAEVFKGDILSASGKSISVGNVFIEDGTYSFYVTDNNPTPLADGSYIFTVESREKVINLKIGDVYHRARNCIVSTSQINTLTYSNASSNNSNVEFIEDYSVSDFFKSKSSSIGRPFAYIPDGKKVRRKASITYSDSYLMDSDRLGLSSFNLSLANWKDLEILDGDVQAIINRNESLTVLQKNKACQIPVGRNLIEYSDGNANVAVSKNVLGKESYYAGNFGASNPESVVERFGVVYFVDANAGKVIRLSADGITPISDKGMSSFFEEKFKRLISRTENLVIVGGFDPDNDEYLVSVEPVFDSNITIGSDVYDIPVDANSNFTVQGITYTSSTVIWNTWANIWNTFCGNWDDVGNGIIFIDSIFQTQGVLIDSSYLGSSATINIVVTDSSYSFSAIAQLNLSTGVVTMPSSTCEGDDISISSAEDDDSGFTISYKHKEGVWASKYSFIPSMYVNVNNEMYSFFDADSGIMWKHNVNDTRNNFYGTQYDSVFEVVSNRNPSMIKVFDAMGVEGSGSWSGVLTTSDQSTTIGTSDFDTREGHSYAMIFRDTLVSKGHQIYLGKVESVSNDTITFTTPINKIPFSIGDILKTASGSTLTDTTMEISGISGRKTIQCTTNVSNVNVGDDVFVEHSSRIDGDPMRDVFLKIKLTSSDTSPFEVHAVSVNYDRSKVHNDRVN